MRCLVFLNQRHPSAVWQRLNYFLDFIQTKFWKDRGAISNGAGADG
jgi:hypothetical protein